MELSFNPNIYNIQKAIEAKNAGLIKLHSEVRR